MNQAQFESLQPGDVIQWSSGGKSIVVDPRIAKPNKGEKKGEFLRLQHFGGGCMITLREYTGTGIDWSNVTFLERSNVPKSFPFTKPTKFNLPVEFIYEPGNGTRFDVTMMETVNGMLLVALTNFKSSYTFRTQVSPGYVQEKLRLPAGDAEHIADLINTQLGDPSHFAHRCEICHGATNNPNATLCSGCALSAAIAADEAAKAVQHVSYAAQRTNYAHHDEGDDNR